MWWHGVFRLQYFDQLPKIICNNKKLPHIFFHEYTDAPCDVCGSCACFHKWCCKSACQCTFTFFCFSFVVFFSSTHMELTRCGASFTCCGRSVPSCNIYTVFVLSFIITSLHQVCYFCLQLARCYGHVKRGPVHRVSDFCCLNHLSFSVYWISYIILSFLLLAFLHSSFLLMLSLCKITVVVGKKGTSDFCFF